MFIFNVLKSVLQTAHEFLHASNITYIIQNIQEKFKTQIQKYS